jgi:penicillin-binding protein 2
LRFKKKWSIGDTLNLCIGQGFTLTTPIQLARLCAAICSNGKLFTPTLNKVKKPEYMNLDICTEHLRVLQQGMYNAVNNRGGTSHTARSIKVAVAGKTGTSQVHAKKNNQDLSKLNVPIEKRNHALFVGFAPFDNPRYATSVIVEHGGGGGIVASPIGINILLAALSSGT